MYAEIEDVTDSKVSASTLKLTQLELILFTLVLSSTAEALHSAFSEFGIFHNRWSTQTVPNIEIVHNPSLLLLCFKCVHHGTIDSLACLAHWTKVKACFVFLSCVILTAAFRGSRLIQNHHYTQLSTIYPL